MEPIHLYTENFLALPRAKNLLKKALGRSFRGPQAVEQSLALGLKELGQVFDINQAPKNFGTVGVLSGVATLRQAIAWKEKGLVKKIVAGPNLVVTPDDNQKIIQHPLIDVVLQPGQWSADFYASVAPSLAPKLRIWAAGVDVPAQSNTPKTNDFLVYNKIGRSELFLGIENLLKADGYKFQTLEYGKFRQKDYFEALNRSKALIYLPESESQGLAMFEAWARNVPTLVYEKGFWKHGGYFWQGLTSSQYVAKENGLVFRNMAEFKLLLGAFKPELFSPRAWVMENFTNAVCAKKYLEIYNNV